ncbi:MAG: DUF2066 domain-containing protein [Magnetococcales bacterium]|nr:DUF2066 domain-containing protein [Magnetococcales bacterium]
MKKFSKPCGVLVGWFLRALPLWLICALGTAWAAEPAKPAEKKAPSIYEVLNVDVSLPVAAAKGGEGLHDAGVAQAQKEALSRLLRRLLPSAEREKRKEWLAALLKDPKRLVERTVVRGEKQHQDRLTMSVSLVFSKKELSEALVKEGISFNETPYPVVLLLAKEDSLSGVGEQSAVGQLRVALANVARDYGMTLLLPLGDLEELSHLSWEGAERGDPAQLEWANTRYAATAIWAIRADATTASVKGATEKTRASATLLVNRAGVAQANWQVSEEKSGKSGETASAALYGQVADKLVRQIADRWIQEHALRTGEARQQIRLRLVHNAQLAQQTKFLGDLRALPGMREPQVLKSTARETVYAIEFQGSQEQLREALGKMAPHVEQAQEGIDVWLTQPPPQPHTPPVQEQNPPPERQEVPAGSSGSGWL